MTSCFRLTITMAVALAIGAGNLPAGDLRSTEFMSEARLGFESIYRLDYASANLIFQRLAEEYPEHPAPPLYLAANAWLQLLFERLDLDLDKFVSPGYFAAPTTAAIPEFTRQTFEANMRKARELCQTIMQDHPHDLEALYFLGAIEGVQGSYVFTVEHSVGNAFTYGKRAYRYHSQILERAPDFYDAYLSAGLYEYIVANLPWYIRWFTSFFGFRGSEERGFEYLNLAAQNGEFVAEDSRVLQMVLFVREKRYRDGLRIAEQLHAKYPENYIFHINRAQILEKMDRRGEALDHYRRISQLAAAGAPNYQGLRQAGLNLQIAAKFRMLGDLDQAAAYYRAALASPDASERDLAIGHLELGRILFLLRRTAEASGHLKTVLTLPDADGSVRQAWGLLEQLGLEDH